MPRLTPCPACHVHVLSDDRQCPHCGATLRAGGAPRVAAVVVGLTLGGCILPQPAYGIPDPDTDGSSSGTAGSSSGSGTDTDATDGMTSTADAGSSTSTSTGGSSSGADETAGSDGSSGSSGPEPAYGVPGTTSG
jgi:hypothetical protein